VGNLSGQAGIRYDTVERKMQKIQIVSKNGEGFIDTISLIWYNLTDI
jgi:hypothetical protein